MIEHLRRKVGWTAAEALCFVLDVVLGESEVGQLYMPLPVQQDILGFEIAVQNILAVQVIDSEEQLGHVDSRFVLTEAHLSSEVEAEILPRAVIQRQIKVVGRLEGIVQVDDERVVRLLQNFGFGDGVLQLLLQNQSLLF